MKKSLSILLALLMILSSLPVMAFTVSAEQADPNVLKDYTYQNWQQRRWDSSLGQGAEGVGDGNRIRMGANYQTAYTTVTLQPNKEYKFDFNWKSETNENKGGIFPAFIYVFAESDYGSNEALLAPAATKGEVANYNGSGRWHDDAGDFYPAGKSGTLTSTGTDLETDTNGTYDARKNAVAGTWQHLSTKFTTTGETNYAIMILFQINSTGDQGGNAIQSSDFRLITTDDSKLIPLEDKMASDWTPSWSAKYFVDDNSLTQDGITSKYKMTNITWHTLGTTVVLKPNTTYIFSGDHYNKGIEGEDYYIGRIQILPASKVSSLDSVGDVADALGVAWPTKTYDTWLHSSFCFTTGSETEYVLQLNGAGTDAGATHVNETAYLANFKITKPDEKPGNLLDNATYGNGMVSFKTSKFGYDAAVAQKEEWLEPRMSFNDYKGGLDNPAYALNGGYSWGFGFGAGYLGGNTSSATDPANDKYNFDEYKDIFGYVTIKANGLKAGKTYDFSYIHADGQRFKIDSIKSGDNAVSYITEPTYIDLGNPNGKYQKGAEKVEALFTVPVDGDYVVTLKSNRSPEYTTSYNSWSTTILCDLELYERGALYNVAVAKEGYGVVNASKTGLVEEGAAVTFTAHADLYEKFEGWYVGDTLVSKENTYAHTVTADVTVVGKFTERSENLMADYTTSNFITRDWGYIQNGASRFGGNAVRGYNIPHQRLITKVNLEAGKEYTLSFECRALENISNKEYITGIAVQKILTPEIDILDKPVNGVSYSGSLGDDIEAGVNGDYGSQETANTCTWQNVTTTFTPTESGEYAITISFGHNKFTAEEVAEINRVNGSNLKEDANNSQSVDFSDFILKEKPVITYTGTKYEWHGERWARVSDSDDSLDGGYAYHVSNAMSQNISTTLNLKPGATYKFSFNWKAVDNANGLAYAGSPAIFSANSGNNVHPVKADGSADWDAACNYEHYGEGANTDFRPTYSPNEGYANLLNEFNNPNGLATTDDEVLTNWNTCTGTFTTIEDTDYYFFIYFGLKGINNSQAAIISDFVVEEVVEGTAPAADDMIAHPGVSIRKNTESAYGQALRYKFIIDGDVIANAQADGYELVEYGTVVALVDDLAGHAADPILNATSYTVRTGVAYDTANGINKQFAVDANGDVTYTAALYNIPTANYGADIAVRPYAKFKNAEGESYIRYGTTRMASVFAVVEEVLAGSNADDIAYVNGTMLVGDVLNAYNEWLANK